MAEWKAAASAVRELLQGRPEAQASGSHQRGAEHLGPIVAKVPEKTLVTSCPPNSGRTKGSAKGVCWLVVSCPFQVPSPTV